MHPPYFMVCFLCTSGIQVSKGGMVVCLDALYLNANFRKEGDSLFHESQGVTITKSIHDSQIAYLTNNIYGRELVSFARALVCTVRCSLRVNLDTVAGVWCIEGLRCLLLWTALLLG